MVGLMKAGRAPPFLAGVVLPLVVGVDLRCAPPGLGGAAVLAVPWVEAGGARLFPEEERLRFSLLLPESPRRTLAPLLPVMLERLPPAGLAWLSAAARGLTCAGARGRLVRNEEDDPMPAPGRDDGRAAPCLKDPSLDCLLSEPVERAESARERGRAGVAPPPELGRDPEERPCSGKAAGTASPLGVAGELCVPSKSSVPALPSLPRPRRPRPRDVVLVVPRGAAAPPGPATLPVEAEREGGRAGRTVLTEAAELREEREEGREEREVDLAEDSAPRESPRTEDRGLLGVAAFRVESGVARRV